MAIPQSTAWGHSGIFNEAQFANSSAAQFAGQEVYVERDGALVSYYSDGANWVKSPDRSQTTALWAASGMLAQNAVAKAMLELSQPQLFPVPVRSAPLRSTGTVRYVNFGAGGTNAGTLANPYNTAAGVNAGLAAMVAGDALLFALGSTATINAPLAAATGTSVAPVVFGVYDPATGNRVSGRRAAATVSCGGAAISAVVLTNKNWTCVEGLQFQSNTGANSLVSLTGTSANCQILNCAMISAGLYGVFHNASGVSNVIESNLITGGTNGIWHQAPGADTTTSIVFNMVRNSAERGILVYDGFSGTPLSVTVACNVVEDGAVTDPQLGGIEFICGGGASRVFRNVVRRFGRGIRVVSSIAGSTVAANFAGLVIQNNDTSNNEFGILLSGAFGNWSIEYNRVFNSGSLNGVAPVSPQRWGRGIELFGAVAGMAVSDGTVRFNYVTGSYNWPGVAVEGTEGIGIGLDDNTINVDAYGNYCAFNEGSGFNVNGGGSGSGRANRVFGNICYANCTLRPGRVLNWNHPSLRSEIHSSVCNYAQIYNNTLVSTVALYSYADFDIFSGVGVEVRNNLCIGARIAGIRRDTTAGRTTESHNRVIDCPSIVVNLLDNRIQPGTGSAIGAPQDFEQASPFYNAARDGACDGAGTAVPSGALSFSGQPLAIRTPIGAVHADFP